MWFWVGGAALGAVVFFLVVRGTMAVIIGPVLGEPGHRVGDQGREVARPRTLQDQPARAGRARPADDDRSVTPLRP